MTNFKILKQSSKSDARLGLYNTKSGNIKTPFFMPVATQGAVKNIATAEMKKLDAQILLSNTYHLMLRPGEKLVKKMGGLHRFMDWKGPILTDSGGFQVFSLGGTKKRTKEPLVKLSPNGVKFKSYIDGKEYFLTPEKSYQIQCSLGVDIAVCLDECVALPATKQKIKNSVKTTTSWAIKTKSYAGRKLSSKTKKGEPLLHCVIQGGLDKEMRLKSLSELKKLDFDGYNIGGLSVGESPDEMYEVLDYLLPEMPIDKPRYLMGVGYPENIVEAVRRGVDMFDCVIPTREGRHGRLFSFKNLKIDKFDNFYKSININNAKFRLDNTPINQKSRLAELRNYSKAYLHYLFKIKEPLGMRLSSLNNLEFYLELMSKIRQNIKLGKF